MGALKAIMVAALFTAPSRFTVRSRGLAVLPRRSVLAKQHQIRRPWSLVRCGKWESDAEITPPVKAPENLVESVEVNGNQPSVMSQKCDGVLVPEVEYPTEKGGESGFFPVREPGNFPSTEISKIEEEEEEEEEVEYDPLRDGPLRYLGYANELGEAFAAWLPVGGVPLSYAIAVTYVLFDTRDKGLKAFSEAKNELEDFEETEGESVNTKRLTNLLAVERATDTIVWQLLASVIIPGYTIHTVVGFIHYVLQSGLHVDNPSLMVPAVAASLSTVAATFSSNTDTVAAVVEKSVPTFCGLATIPFIVHPIDETVHAILNVSMRPALRKFLCVNGQGCAAGLAICDETCMKTDFPVLSEETNIIEAFTQSFDE